MAMLHLSTVPALNGAVFALVTVHLKNVKETMEASIPSLQVQMSSHPRTSELLSCTNSARLASVTGLVQRLSLGVECFPVCPAVQSHEAFESQSFPSCRGRFGPLVGAAPGSELLGHHFAVLVPHQVLRCQASTSLLLFTREHPRFSTPSLGNLRGPLHFHGLHGFHGFHGLSLHCLHCFCFHCGLHRGRFHCGLHDSLHGSFHASLLSRSFHR